MTSLRIAFVLVVVALVGSGLSAAQAPRDVTVELALDRDSTLPGIPVGFFITVTNRTREELAVPKAFALEVTTPDGRTFIAPWNEWDDRGAVILGDYSFVLRPNQARTFQVPVTRAMNDPEIAGSDPQCEVVCSSAGDIFHSAGLNIPLDFSRDFSGFRSHVPPSA